MKSFIIPKLTLTLLCSVFSNNLFALTDQISLANKYLTSFDNTLLDNSSNVSISIPYELRIGQKNEKLKLLQKQLGLVETGVFDQDTLKFIQQEQKNLNLNVTKTLDLNTWYSLYDQPLNWKINIVKQSVLSWKKIIEQQQQMKSEQFVVVDIPSMTLYLYDWDGTQSHEKMKSRVVVGKKTTETPMKNFYIWGIKYNPTWTPTDNILKRGLYKNGEIDTNWIKRHGLSVKDTDGNIVELDDINEDDKYFYQQPSGNNNALGVLKFETTSSDNIYLHDTNEKHYFSQNTRIFSSGCIRVQDFKDLASNIGNKDSSYINMKINKKETSIEKIKNKIPVYFTYSQVHFTDNMTIYSPDIYNKNKLNN
jgi:murein L,D-transpeptidase YcbB/YkuD